MARVHNFVVDLPAKGLWDFDALLAFFAARALTEFEFATETSYARVLLLPSGPGVMRVFSDRLELRVCSGADKHEAAMQARCLLGLDLDVAEASRALNRSRLARRLMREHMGIRTPVHPSPFETLLRAIVGQQVSVAGARTTLARLVVAHGEPLPNHLLGFGPTRSFPTAETLAGCDPSTFGMPRTRSETLHAAAADVASGALNLAIAPDNSVEAIAEALLARRGIGPWTVGYVRLRGLGDPDVFLGSDLGIAHAAALHGVALSDLTNEALRCAPHRSLFTTLLWASLRS